MSLERLWSRFPLPTLTSTSALILILLLFLLGIFEESDVPLKVPVMPTSYPNTRLILQKIFGGKLVSRERIGKPMIGNVFEINGFQVSLLLLHTPQHSSRS
jgi:hypothetical protein